MKLDLLLFNRATYSRMKAFIAHALASAQVELNLIVSSSLLWGEFGGAIKEIEANHPGAKITRLPIEKPTYTKQSMAKAQSMIATALSAYYVDSSPKPDVGMVIADRYETLPAAQVLASLSVPIIHVQGGEVTGNIDEKIRHAVTKLSDYHFAATDLSGKYLIQMGEDEERVFVTGCPSLDLIRTNHIRRKGGGQRKRPLILSIFHPETEASEEAFEQTKLVMESVIDYCERFNGECEWYYPNPDPGRKQIVEYLDKVIKNHSFLTKAIHLPAEDFLWKLAQARLVIGNSSCLIRETSYLGTPSVLVGDRQAIRERGWNVVEVDYDHDQIRDALLSQHDQQNYPPNKILFGIGKSAPLMLDYLMRIAEEGFSIKGPLTYPAWPQFKEIHFGSAKQANKSIRTASKQIALSSESGSHRAFG